ncbi:MAG: hypothetical protein IIC88_02645 [Chloroflexi bacterium]|nr:hypothetical protein [Chloroflexota bacterium]
MARAVKKRADIRSLLGDPKRVDEELQHFRKATAVLSSRHPRLIESYPRQWVAVYDGEVKAHAKTFDSLMVQVDKQKLPRARTIVRYIDKTQRTLIL